MGCLRCKNLERALKVRQSEYMEALASAFYPVSRKLAAYTSVEVERARNELEEHRSICASAVKQPAASVAKAPPRPALEQRQGDRTGTAA